ncbi:MFS transporter [Nocardioides sp. BP30]|uniref:MFS transporter n=1 Tax=Nocardioides sp. BP30 TaxID=3036374 RepID=UPI00246918C2|nr:MFS transporter [Nocardioides sp. BP30]WGL52996.1 MFS transporter [Nocardioides sp. BP30]
MSHLASTEDSAQGTEWWTLSAVCTGVFMLLLDITIVNVALPDIQQQLHADLSGLQWVIDAYALSLAALLLTAGSLADLFGRRLLFVIGTIVFTIGSAACGAAQNITFLQLSRAFQGIGGAAMFATALALLASAYRGRERGIAFGAFGATTGVAVAIGPVLGGLLTSGLSWRWIFFVNIPICAVALGITVARVKESQDPKAGRPDWFGFVSFSLALGALVYGLIEAGRPAIGWGSARVIACMIAAVVLLIVFVVGELRQRQPMFDLGLLRKPTFCGGLVAAFGVSSSVFSLLTYLVIYVQDVLGYSAVATGVRFLFLSGASFVAAAIAGRLTERVPTKLLIGPGFLILSLGLFLLLGIDAQSTWKHLIPGMIVCGLGVGMINPPLASTAVGVVTPDRSGMASGVNSTFRQVGIATGIAALGSIFATRISDGISGRLAGSQASPYAGKVAEGVTGGQLKAVVGRVPAAAREKVSAAAVDSFTSALDHIILIAAVIALIAGLASLVLIRQRDFVAESGPAQGA